MPVRDDSKDRDTTHYKTVETQFEKLVCYANPPRMFDWCDWVFNHKLDVEFRPYLVQDYPKIVRFGIGKHDKLEPGGGLVVVELVFSGAVRQKAWRDESPSALKKERQRASRPWHTYRLRRPAA